MKRASLLLLALVALAAGCRTNAMKGTPFFTGEYKGRVGPAENRVNLWPLVYWRDPALSVLWPLGEFAPDRMALRPVFSKYRDGESGPWTQYNWLGGLVCIDRATGENVAFPFYWGSREHRHWDSTLGATVATTNSYFHIFPLWWSSHDPGADRRFHSLFPLWVYSRRGENTTLFCPWPIAGSFRDPFEHRTFLFPLWDATRYPGHPERHDDRFGLLLAGRSFDGTTRQSWIVPFYYARSGGTNDTTFLSLPWASKDDRWRAIPLLLSSWSPDGDWGRVLLGLGGWDGSRSWTFPFYYYDAATGEFLSPLCYRNPSSGVFLSPLWASKDDAWRCVPPLLSAWSPDGGWGRALLGLSGWDDSRAWAFPFFYRDTVSDTLVTPLWAHQAAHWSAIPPLLAWWTQDPATGEHSTYLLGGLVGFTPAAHWFAPLYYSDARNDRFLSLLYAHGADWSAVPPLLSWWDDDGGRILLFLGGWQGDASWIFPLWYGDRERFFTPLWGRWRGKDQTVTYWATPLLGTKSGRETGWWFLPFGGSFRDRDGSYRYNYLLLGGGRGSPQTSADWFLPLFHDRSDEKVARFRNEMDADRAPERSFVRSVQQVDWRTHETNAVLRYEREEASEGTDVLLGLGGTSHRVQVNPSSGSLPDDLGVPASGSPLERFIAPGAPNGTNDVARYLAEDEDWFFPLWSYDRKRAAMFDLASGDKTLDAEKEDFSLLWFLYDYKRESVPGDGHEYTRRRVLWRLYHEETLDGDSSIDIFPGIGIDSKKNGYRKVSFLWRLFRYEDDPDKGTSLDILFLPICRP